MVCRWIQISRRYVAIRFREISATVRFEIIAVARDIIVAIQFILRKYVLLLREIFKGTFIEERLMVNGLCNKRSRINRNFLDF